MNYRARISTLEETHRLLDIQITKLESTPGTDPMMITEMKKKKLQYQDDIRRMRREQFEYETQTINYGDE
jgi:hypothetical protein